MKYKVGDKVKIKSLDWYNENKKKELRSCIECGNMMFTPQMSKWCGKIVTIIRIENNCYMDENARYWTDEMIEGLVEDEMPLDKAGQITDFEYEGLAYTLPEGYIFKDENGNVINATKIVLEKKKKEYPKTYEECCEIVGFGLKWDNPFRINRDTHPYMKHLDELMRSLCKLLICRDAYWKIAGEEMGLGKPWEPDWNNGEQTKWIINFYKDEINLTDSINVHFVLTFPTEEMRDAFYENFKEEIEICKELL